MIEQKVEEDVLTRLIEQYGEALVTVEPRLGDGTTVYPDFAVFKEEDATNPYLIVECSSFRTAHRQQRDLSQVTEAVEATGAEYAALVSPDVEFVFSGTGPGFRTFPSFPELDRTSPMTPRPIRSDAELDFLISRALAAQKSAQSSSRRNAEMVDMLFESLHLLIQARDEEVKLDSSDDSEIHHIQSQIKNKHESYVPNEGLERSEILAVRSIFNGYDLKETDDGILESLFELTSEDVRGDEYSTPLPVAKQMVRLSRVSEGDTVVDPAAGRGTILSLAAARGVHATGLDINRSITSLATFFIDLFERDIQISVGNFFDEDAGLGALPDSIDHIIVDPPFNAEIKHVDIPHADGRRAYSQDAFLAKGLSRLREGGSITISVPASFLENIRSRWIRQAILDEYQLDSVIQMVGGPLYQNTQIDTALLTVSKKSPNSSHSVDYVVLESPDDPAEALEHAVTRIKNGAADSILQSDLDNRLNFYKRTTKESAHNELENIFEQIVKLESVAELSRGNSQGRGVVEASGENTIRYLSPRDLHDQSYQSGSRYLPREEARTLADETCVLMSLLGKRHITYIPTEQVAPAQSWAIIKFDTSDTALVYKTFFDSDLGQQQIQGLKTGSTMQQVRIGELREMYVPYLNEEEIESQVAKIRDRNRQIKELEAEQEQLQRERDQLAGDLDDLLKGGDNDE